MVPGLKRPPALFYRSDTGREPLREVAEGLGPGISKDHWEDVKDVEFSWPIGMPRVRSLGNRLWEVRSNITDGRIARIIFCVVGDQMVLLHGFVKKTQKTPKSDIDLALKRMKGANQ